MTRFAEAVVEAARQTGGLVDATLLGEIEVAGYRGAFEPSISLPVVLESAPVRRPAGPSPRRDWDQIAVDRSRGTVSRPVGVKLDSGGLARAWPPICSPACSAITRALRSTPPGTCAWVERRASPGA